MQFYLVNIDSRDVNGPFLNTDDTKEEIETLSDEDVDNTFVISLSGIGESHSNEFTPADDWAAKN